MLTCLPLLTLAETLSDDIVILYTNDIHTYIDNPLSYDVIAAIKKDLKNEYKHVILADAGDHVQGTAYGSMDKGESIIKLMNAADYDVATLGNHEFDYNMQGCMNIIDWADFSYISCNFYRENDGVRGANVLDSYVMFDCGDEKVAFVGITSPETFSKSTPAYFQDENGKFIYGISGGEDGAALHSDIQTAVNNAKDDGATQIIALGHLGVDASSMPWTSEETIAGVSGLDAFIDGHSHTEMKRKDVKDKDGNEVVLTQTGEYFSRIGMMVIDSQTGDITTDFIEIDGNEDNGYTLSSELYSETNVIVDDGVKGVKDAWISQIDAKLGEKIGSTDLTFDNYDSDLNRLVRKQETNSGDFAADALYYLFDDMGLDVDVAVMNGGGIRNKAITGDISYKTCKDMHTFGNVACLQTVTGQQILDMLEWGARHVGVAESGAFLQVSGITYKIDTSVENTTTSNEFGAWTGGPTDGYRVYDVKVYNKQTNKWNKLSLNAKYNLAGYNYTLRDLGDGFAMLDGSVNVVDYVMEDYMVLSNYVKGFDNGVIEAKNSPLLEKYPNMLIDYAKLNGSGRIVIAKRSDDTSSDSGKTESGTSSGANSNTKSGNNNSDTSPKTGDDRNLWLLFSLIFVSGAGVFVITLNRCKKLEKQ
ncbi:MAG: bifunctional metallophosphatase/5'-nucleotidase [Clostridia bacterium]|nr:bifunctional metallophosphatase/5'-nucleotidase [Clostridia bacterium]